MSNSSIRKGISDTLLTVLFCASGFFAIWLAKKQMGMIQESVFVAFLILPLVIYMIVAGRLLEFKAFGAEAKFADAAKQSIEPTLGTIEPSVQDIQIVAKAGITELHKRRAHLDETKPIILTLIAGRHKYEHWALEKYIDVLAQCASFKGVVICRPDGTFASYYPPRAFSAILKSAEGEEFLQHINEGQVEWVQRCPGAIIRTLTKQSSNLDALKEMTLLNADSLVVINEQGKLSGIVERHQLISKLLIAMAK